MPDEILTIDDARRELGCSVRHLKKLLRDKKIKGRKVGQSWTVVLRSSLEAYLRGEK